MRITAIPLLCTCAQHSSSHLVQLLTYLHLLPDLNKILWLMDKIIGTKIGFQDAQRDRKFGLLRMGNSCPKTHNDRVLPDISSECTLQNKLYLSIFE